MSTITPNVTRHYSTAQLEALVNLYSLVKKNAGTSGGNAAAKLLLGLYNGGRFPFDLTDLRVFDSGNLDAALVVLEMDARRTYTEVHTILDSFFGDGISTGAEFELWAWNLKLPKRCKKEYLTTKPLRRLA